MIAHLVWATVTALSALAAARAIRGRRASWRYAIILAGLLRFAVPTPWLSRLGAGIADRLLPHGVTLPDFGALNFFAGPSTALVRIAAPPDARGFSWWWLVWGTGSLVCFAIWGRRWFSDVPAVREASPNEVAALQRACAAAAIARTPELRIATRGCSPGVWRSRIVLPEGLSAELDAAEFGAVLAHELGHVRRRDNLWAAAAHAVVCGFWFHPLVWWLERRLMEERELACDEAALASGTPPEEYAAGLAKVCQMAFAGAGYAGFGGANLERRMEYIMTVAMPERSSNWMRAAAAALVGIATMLPMAGGFVRAQDRPTTQAVAGPGDAAFRRGVQLLSQKDYAAAEAAFRDAYALEPANVRYLAAIAEVYGDQGRWAEAVELLRAEQARNPRLDAQAVSRHIANSLVRGGMYDQAVVAFQQPLPDAATDKDRGDLYLLLGEVYRRKGDTAQALTALRRAQALMPDSPVVLNTLSLVLDSSGQGKEAADLYREAIRREPENGVALNNLAYQIVRQNGNLDEALALADRARKLLPNLPEASDTYGWVLYRRGQIAEAAEVFKGVVKQSPDHAQFHVHLGLALVDSGDRAGALEQLTAARRLAGSDTIEEMAALQKKLGQ